MWRLKGIIPWPLFILLDMKGHDSIVAVSIIGVSPTVMSFIVSNPSSSICVSSFIVMPQLQEQAGQLQKYLQQLGQLPVFQKGLEQALGKDPQQHLQTDQSHNSTRPKPRVPISGMLSVHHCFSVIIARQTYAISQSTSAGYDAIVLCMMCMMCLRLGSAGFGSALLGYTFCPYGYMFACCQHFQPYPKQGWLASC